MAAGKLLELLDLTVASAVIGWMTMARVRGVGSESRAKYQKKCDAALVGNGDPWRGPRANGGGRAVGDRAVRSRGLGRESDLLPRQSPTDFRGR
jgi:hypothetical protein